MPKLVTPVVSLSRVAVMATLMAAVLTGCMTPKPHRAPVEERGFNPAPATSVVPAPAPEAKAASAESRPGFYTVKPGDTLIRIALDQGIGWRDLARWNGLDNPNLIEVGQVLRVAPPVTADSGATRPVAPPPRVETKPLEAKAPATGASPTAPVGTASAVTAAGSAASAPAVAAAPPVAGASDVNWAWPAPGNVVATFDEQRNNNGLSIGGKAGEPVLAAADGTVMYAGSGIRGYGNMIVIKHNDTFLSAYAHNQVLLVKEDQVVRRGQQIAQMGNSESESVKLHFEIRRRGKPVDPARLLPPR